MKRFKDVLNTISSQNNTTPEEVLKEMQIAINESFDNPDPAVQKQWSKTPFKGEKPTPEEVISCLALALSTTYQTVH